MGLRILAHPATQRQHFMEHTLLQAPEFAQLPGRQVPTARAPKKRGGHKDLKQAKSVFDGGCLASKKISAFPKSTPSPRHPVAKLFLKAVVEGHDSAQNFESIVPRATPDANSVDFYFPMRCVVWAGGVFMTSVAYLSSEHSLL